MTYRNSGNTARNTPLEPDEVERLKALHAADKTDIEIAAALGVSSKTVGRYRRAYGLAPAGRVVNHVVIYGADNAVGPIRNRRDAENLADKIGTEDNYAVVVELESASDAEKRLAGA